MSSSTSSRRWRGSPPSVAMSLLDVAIGGLLARPAVSSVIAGATKPEQVRANVAAARWAPSDSDLGELEELLNR